jgi:hypothetical protein
MQAGFKLAGTCVENSGAGKQVFFGGKTFILALLLFRAVLHYFNLLFIFFNTHSLIFARLVAGDSGKHGSP